MPEPSSFSLEKRLADLESEVRSLRSANLLNRASVVNAEGDYVELSSLAFGQAAATSNGLVELWGTANAGPGGVAWTAGAPSVDVRVTGGRLRVDIAGALVASGNKCSAFLGYSVLGPGLAEGTQTVEFAAPAYERAVECQHSGTGMDARLAAGTFALHEGLPEGWYTVAARYALSYSGSTTQPYGAFTNRRLSATPY